MGGKESDTTERLDLTSLHLEGQVALVAKPGIYKDGGQCKDLFRLHVQTQSPTTPPRGPQGHRATRPPRPKQHIMESSGEGRK